MVRCTVVARSPEPWDFLAAVITGYVKPPYPYFAVQHNRIFDD
jgi:hypothetical protein